ncbi:MAG: lipopolysaccharide assembly protein LapA domain-containing protein [marine benthic group bacterium]|jgi:antibiotic biosynthesis monooxygenase (ABM) superfamily enzyme|nr:lipopolysaccharide assembly protein LapA domain-containing protein [Candidatus Benthicola marisminoris]
MADVKKTLLSIQQVFLLIVAVAVVFFAFLNLDPVTINLFFTTVTTSVALLLLVPLAAGMMLGWVGGRLRAGRKAKAPAAVGKGPAELPPAEEKIEDVDWQNLDLDKIDV